MNDRKINCWEYMACGRGPGQGSDTCPAASDTAFDGMNNGLNAGRSCWLVAGTACTGRVSGTFAKAFETCRKCAFFKKVHAQKERISLGIKNIDIVGCTHTGLIPKTNEDRYLVKIMDDRALMLAVADGLGGGVSSDIAAEMVKGRLSALKRIPVNREAQFLDKFARDLDEFIHGRAQIHPGLSYMATTLVCLVLKNDRIHWVNVGDSRCYILRDRQLIQITEDQTLAKALVDQGVLQREEAGAHYSQKILDQCLGYGICEPDTGSFKVRQDDTVILATDGLYKMIGPERMARILNSDRSLKRKITALTDAALSSGGKDNITIVLAHIRQTL